MHAVRTHFIIINFSFLIKVISNFDSYCMPLFVVVCFFRSILYLKWKNRNQSLDQNETTTSTRRVKMERTFTRLCSIICFLAKHSPRLCVCINVRLVVAAGFVLQFSVWQSFC